MLVASVSRDVSGFHQRSRGRGALWCINVQSVAGVALLLMAIAAAYSQGSASSEGPSGVKIGLNKIEKDDPFGEGSGGESVPRRLRDRQSNRGLSKTGTIYWTSKYAIETVDWLCDRTVHSAGPKEQNMCQNYKSLTQRWFRSDPVRIAEHLARTNCRKGNGDTQHGFCAASALWHAGYCQKQNNWMVRECRSVSLLSKMMDMAKLVTKKLERSCVRNDRTPRGFNICQRVRQSIQAGMNAHPVPFIKTLARNNCNPATMPGDVFCKELLPARTCLENPKMFVGRFCSKHHSAVRRSVENNQNQRVNQNSGRMGSQNHQNRGMRFNNYRR